MRRNQAGFSNTLLVALFLGLLLVGAAAFGAWAFMSRNDYKDHADAKAVAAVAAAKDAREKELAIVFAEKEKQPTQTYKGSAVYGSITFSYPKTWSAYVDETSGSIPINGYFHPGIVPGVQSRTAYALRLELVTTDYSSVVKEHDSQIKAGTAKATAYVPPKMKAVNNVQTGTRIDGALDQNFSGSMVIIKVRDKTMKIYTMSKDFQGDFDNIVLDSLTFAP